MVKIEEEGGAALCSRIFARQAVPSYIPRNSYICSNLATISRSSTEVRLETIDLMGIRPWMVTAPSVHGLDKPCAPAILQHPSGKQVSEK